MEKGERIGYVRVSTVEQHEDRQIATLDQFSITRLFVEKASAKDTNRPVFKQMMEYVRSGDTLYITDFSRRSRSTKDLLATVDNLTSRGVNLISIKENFDTKKPEGKLFMVIISAINEFERDILLERQSEGIALAKKNGVYKGRKRIIQPINFIDAVRKYRNGEISAKKAMEITGLKTNTFYRILRDYLSELENQIIQL